MEFYAGTMRYQVRSVREMRPLLYPTCNYSKTGDKRKSRPYNTFEKRKAARVVERRTENPLAGNAVGSGLA